MCSTLLLHFYFRFSDRSDSAKAAELEACELLQTYCNNIDSTFLISLLKTEQGDLPEGFDFNSSNDNVDNGGDNLKRTAHCLSKDEVINVKEEVVKSDNYIEPRGIYFSLGACF